MNVLVITLDQMRGDCLSCAGHPLVQTPSIDRLAAEGVRFARHYSQAAPCAPGRACLYTGTYQLNNRVVGNGTPLDDRFDNMARAARRAGYRPVLFGYTDVGVDPRLVERPDDPRLSTYEGVLPGFDVELDLREAAGLWLAWLEDLGYPPKPDAGVALRTESQRPAEHGITAFAVNRFLAWVQRQDDPWWAHLSLLRPHPPYSAAGKWARAYDPGDVALPPAAPSRVQTHPFLRQAMARPGVRAPRDEAALRRLLASYYGMVSHVDQELGRVWATLECLGAWDDTLVVLTSDHGEQLGDQGLIGKLGFFEASYHIPAIVRDPRYPQCRGLTVDRFTENVDLFPTLCEAMGLAIPALCDGVPLTPFLRGLDPPWWRTAAHWEYDWRIRTISRSGSEEPASEQPGPEQPASDQGDGPGPALAVRQAWPWHRWPERQNLAVIRNQVAAYVQFGDGSWLAFDLGSDPTWATPLDDPAQVHALAASMLAWRAEHADRTMTGFVLADGGIGRRP